MVHFYLGSITEWRETLLGYRTLHLDTTTRQEAARHLYTKNGYREVRRSVWRGFHVIFYEKALTSDGEGDDTTHARLAGERSDDGPMPR